MATNIAPYITTVAGSSWLESQPIDSLYLKLDIKDYDGDDFTFEMIGQYVERYVFSNGVYTGTTTETTDSFYLTGNEIRSTKVFDYDADGYHARQYVTIRAVDSLGNERISNQPINIGDVEETFYSFSTSLTGTLGNDNLVGNRKAEILNGLAGNDRIYGEGGNDKLYGGDGSDELHGGAGNDLLWGGAGFSALYGDDGADRFVFKSVSDSAPRIPSRIFDFSLKEKDKIDLSFMDADTTTAGRQDFHFIGKAAYSGEAGELRYQKLNNGLFVAADVDGDRKTDFMLKIDGVSQVTGDFFLL
jgi:Ca2+-binding RTX toxin-like protein